ncbi:Mov34/MPN/PAD-1 family protein, partial [Ostertagia ostertagi]
DPHITTSSISFPGISAITSPPNEVFSSPKNSVMPSAPAVDRSDKPSVVSHPSHDASSPIGTRIVLIAGDLIQKFLVCAQSNTAKNVETCGTLCGTIVGSAFLVSHVILPKQSGASDGCYAEGEEEVFAYQDKHDLITLGWIHTHPSQTAFLSSVDLHTHCAYQMMLSEAVAIVCAPSHKQIGTFVLTSYGMSVVESCTQKGFHVHPEDEKLFVEADHVKYTRKL